MNENYCFWTVAPGRLALSAQAMVTSARDAGVFKDIHVWADRGLEAAEAHPLGRFDPAAGLFRLTYLRDVVALLDGYEYFVWLDPRTKFLSHPGSLLRVLEDAPVHVTLTFDLANPPAGMTVWNGFACADLARLMRNGGITNSAVFAGLAGFYVVHRQAVKTFFNLAYDFWQDCDQKGYRLTCEPLLAFAMQMLCGEPRKHLMGSVADLWQSLPAEWEEAKRMKGDEASSPPPAILLEMKARTPFPEPEASPNGSSRETTQAEETGAKR